MPRITDERDAESRVRRSIVNYFLQFREEFDRYGLGEGDCSLPAAAWVQLTLKDVQLMHVPGTERHVVLRRHWGGGVYDADLYADYYSSNAKVRAAPAGELYAGLKPITAAMMTDAEFDNLRSALLSTGPDGYADLVPDLDQLRRSAESFRRGLC